MTSRVLVVEDVPALREMLIEALADEGYLVRGAEHGRAALDVLACWRPDLILLDLAMPVMDGLTFLERVGQMPTAADIPVIALSAQADRLGRARGCGARATIQKPFLMEDLLGVIEATLGQARVDQPAV